MNLAPDYGAGYELIGEEVEGIAPRTNGGAQVLPGPPPGVPPPAARGPEPSMQGADFAHTDQMMHSFCSADQHTKLRSAAGVGSVEEALAILRKHEKRKKKSSKSKKHKEKDKKKKKEKKEKKKHSKRSSSSSSSDDN